MNKNVDLLQVQAHMLYIYEEEGEMAKQHHIHTGEKFEDFIADKHTSGILQTGQMVI